MSKPHAGRPGSVLATALGLTTVFLTLIVGSMAYVSTSVTSARSERLRAAAEDAAQTGLELIFGWAEAAIHSENRLPRQWERMKDGDVIDPVKYLAEGKLTDASMPASISDVKAAGSLLGGNDVREMVVGVVPDGGGSTRPAYVTTFKARIQQFRVSENMPRQYRICVVGRVRKPQAGPSRATYDQINAYERESIVAERAVLATMGRETTCRYAALIDIDQIRNWVPGEVVSGPVHINRGYPDLGGYVDDNVDLTSNASIDTVTWQDLRSRMDLNLDIATVPGNPGFKTPAGKDPYPVFKARVSMSEFRDKETWTNDDPGPSAAPVMIRANGKAWHTTTAHPDALAKAQNIFRDPENREQKRYHANRLKLAGPVPIENPLELPRSVANREGTSLRRPGVLGSSDRWRNLPDGLYVPTPRFWGLNGDPAYGDPPPGDSYANSPAPTGGIYIRGNVDHMRFAVGGPDLRTSIYLFQVSDYTFRNHRVYMVTANRSSQATERKLTLYAWPTRTPGSTNPLLYGGVLNATNTTLTQLETVSGLPAGVTFQTSTNPQDWRVGDTGARKVTLGSSDRSQFPFNGVIYVDAAQGDPARKSTPTNDASKHQVTSGHVLALGNMGATNNPDNKGMYMIENQQADVAATHLFESSLPQSYNTPATGLTVVARGNIFIQNHLVVDGVWRAIGGTSYTPTASFSSALQGALETVSLAKTRDNLALVADQRIVMGLNAPSTTTRGNLGTLVMASLAALGDPAYRPYMGRVDYNYLKRPYSYVGSFTTEGVMMSQGAKENYWVPSPNDGTNLKTDTGPTAPEAAGLFYKDITGTYPGNPIYQAEGSGSNTYGPTLGWTTKDPNNNRNYVVRGRLVVFGAITQRKRGIIGSGNNSFDKDFMFDNRLLTTSPPMFPQTVNVVVRAQQPFTPDSTMSDRALPYKGGPSPSPGPFTFLSEPSGAMND